MLKNLKLKLGLAALGLSAILGVGVTAYHPGEADAATPPSPAPQEIRWEPKPPVDQPSYSRLEEW